MNLKMGITLGCLSQVMVIFRQIVLIANDNPCPDPVQTLDSGSDW